MVYVREIKKITLNKKPVFLARRGNHEAKLHSAPSRRSPCRRNSPPPTLPSTSNLSLVEGSNENVVVFESKIYQNDPCFESNDPIFNTLNL